MSHESRSTLSARAAVTVRGLAPELKRRLRIRAAHNSRSMEAEARAILEQALSTPDGDTIDLGTFARTLFDPLGGVELELPPRESAREPPDFGRARHPKRQAEQSPGTGRSSKRPNVRGSRRHGR